MFPVWPLWYAPHAFDSCIGQEVPFKIEGVERSRATVIAVKVDADGTGATWTVDIAGPTDLDGLFLAHQAHLYDRVRAVVVGLEADALGDYIRPANVDRS